MPSGGVAGGYVLLYLDLDQFKLVNDTCGHPAGDQLLKQITGVLQSRVRTGDTLARLGGDEFGILLQDCALDQAMRIAEGAAPGDPRLPLHLAGRRARVGAEHRHRRDHQGDPDVASVMSAADVACYAAKDRAATACSCTSRTTCRSGTARCTGYPSSPAPATRADSSSIFSRSSRSARTVHEREHFEMVCACATNPGGW